MSMYDAELQRLVSVFASANGSVHLWLSFLKPEEVQELLNAAAVIENAQATALAWQKQKIA